MKIVIRPTKYHDISQMIDINRASLPENYRVEVWKMKFYEGKNHSFVAIGAGSVIGYILCDEESIISFATAEKYRDKGIGRQLLHHCLNTYKTPIKLHVRTSNEPALKLYRSLDFIEKETIKDYYDSPVEDAYAMEWIPTCHKYVEIKK